MISIIAAVSKNGVIGKDNMIPWHISADLKRFKELTCHHHVVMGRKTFESLKLKPLPNRINLVISSNNHKFNEAIIIVKSLEHALLKSSHDNETFIIGGGMVYNAAMEFANKMYITRILNDVDGDVFFPEINQNKWIISEYIGNFKDEKSGLDYCYITYEKIL